MELFHREANDNSTIAETTAIRASIKMSGWQEFSLFVSCFPVYATGMQ